MQRSSAQGFGFDTNNLPYHQNDPSERSDTSYYPSRRSYDIWLSDVPRGLWCRLQRQLSGLPNCMKILIFHCIQLYSFSFSTYRPISILKEDTNMQVILFNTNNGSAFEMQFSNVKQMKNYLEENAEIEFLGDNNSYLPTRHQRMQ